MTNEYLPIEDGIENHEIEFQTDDIGSILKTLRLNQGYTILKVSKMTGLSPRKISQVERSLSEIPSDAVLRNWLSKLGCKKNAKKILLVAQQYRVSHTVRLHSGDESNADLVRAIEAYKSKSLSKFDRRLLSLIGR